MAILKTHTGLYLPDAWQYGQSLSRMAEYFDDFTQGGYVADAALSSESDPAAKFSEVANAGEWLVTRDVAPAIVIADADAGGWLSITTGSNANDFVSLQLNGESFATNPNRLMIYEAKIKIDDTDDTKWFAGLASTDVTGTTLGPILDGVNDSIGFRGLTGTDVNIHYVCEDDTTETTADSTKDLADDTAVTLQFVVEGTERVLFYVDGSRVATVTTNIPDSGAGLTPSLEVSSTTASSNLKVDYIRVLASR